MTEPARTPYCHKIRYGITGAPTLTESEMDGSHAPGVGIRPTLIELIYSPARDGKPARIDASVTGDWTRFGEPDGFGGQVTTHFKNGPDGWPAWLAEEARLHDPGTDRERYKAGLRRADEHVNAMTEELKRYADGKEAPVLWSVYNAMHLRADTAEAELKKYVGAEPTIAEELAYLSSCLHAVHDLCDKAEQQAKRWEHPLPVPAWVDQVRKAADGTTPASTPRPALPWAHVMPDDDLHGFLNDLVSAAMGRWQSEPEVPDRDVLANIEKVCANWRTPGQGYRSDDDETGEDR